MPEKIKCSNPDCSNPLAATGEGSHPGDCLTCGWKLEPVDDPDASQAIRGPGQRPSPGHAAVMASVYFVGMDFDSRYRFIRKLGQGGMGDVWLASDAVRRCEVAIKILRHLDEGPRRRFRKEVEAAVKLDHPHICRIFDSGEFHGRPYIVFAYVKGKTLEEAFKGKALPPIRAAKMAQSLARTMQYAHVKGIFHRDLKPANLMVDPHNELIVMDFGIARHEDDSERQTKDGQILGTLCYRSPEQVDGLVSEVGKGSDIFTLGIIFYELLTGRLPFNEKSPVATMLAILNEPAKPPSELRRGIDKKLDEIIFKAMEKRIGNRHESMEEFAKLIEEWLPKISAENVRRPWRSTWLWRLRPGLTKFLAEAVPQPISSKPKPVIPDSESHRETFNHKVMLSISGVMLAVISGLIFYIATDTGTIRIEGYDPSMEVRIDGEVMTKEKVGEPIPLYTGEHDLIIMQDDTRVKAPGSFVVSRGKEVKIAITPPPPPVFGTLKMEGFDHKMLVRIDDKAVTKPGERIKVEEGEHRLLISREGVPISAPKSFRIGRGEETVVKVEFTPQPSDVLTSKELPTLKLVRIEAGKFMRGSEDGNDNEKPVREVTLTTSFYLGIHEVTQAQWQTIMGDEIKSGFRGVGTLPMENISWEEAVAFCNALSKKERLEPPYYTIIGKDVTIKGGSGYRLPTEAEWEYACRARDSGNYCFGDDASKLREHAWYGEGFNGEIHEVGGRKPNEFGLYDMHGNVREWCWDWHDATYYQNEKSYIDPIGPKDGADRVLRGGSYIDAPEFLRSAYRHKFRPAERFRGSGFRIARTSP